MAGASATDKSLRCFEARGQATCGAPQEYGGSRVSLAPDLGCCSKKRAGLRSEGIRIMEVNPCRLQQDR